MQVKPFRALRPPPELADRVASPPYDVVDTAQARELVAGNPMSFLHIIRPEIDKPPGTGLYDDEIYHQAAENLQAFREAGWLVQDEQPRMFVYAQTMGAHTQFGVVGACHVDDYEQDVIRKHEDTIRKKEDDRTRHVESLSAHTGPVFLTYRGRADIDAVVAEATTGAPLYDFVAPDGVRHTVWPVPDSQSLVTAFHAVPLAYVADGHHRSASAARVARMRREANPDHTGEEDYNWFLSVLFPADQLRVLPYNRCVVDLHDLEPDELLCRVNEYFSVQEEGSPVPASSSRVSMFLDGSWVDLSWESDPHADPITGLDVSVLQKQLLEPLLGIRDPRTDPRVTFVGGIHGAAELERRVRQGEAAVAFSLYPVTVEQLMNVADAGRNMPPKSTWFEPKLRSGLLIHTF